MDFRRGVQAGLSLGVVSGLAGWSVLGQLAHSEQSTLPLAGSAAAALAGLPLVGGSEIGCGRWPRPCGWVSRYSLPGYEVMMRAVREYLGLPITREKA